MPKAGEISQTYPHRLQQIGIELLEPFTGSKKHHLMKCCNCNHEWTATPLSKIQTNKKYGVNGCPVCNDRKKQARLSQKRNQAIHNIEELGFEILSEYDGQQTTTSKITVKNIECGHVFDTAPGNILHNNVKCQICNTIKKREQFQLWNVERQQIYQQTASEWEIYKHNVYSITRDSYKQHKKIINPNNVLRGVAGTPGANHLDHIVPVRYCFDNNIPVDVCAHPQNLQMLEWTENVSSRDNLKNVIPPIFRQFISYDEKTKCLINKIQSVINIPIEMDSLVLDPYPVTIYFPTIQMGVLLCTFNEFKQDVTKQTTYNRNILNHAESKGIRILQLFEDEWLSNLDLVTSKIIHYTGQSKLTSIYARKCHIQEISKQQKSEFLNNNHIQGDDNSTIQLGAFFNDTLIAVMTFSPPRVAVGGRQNSNGIELVRFATDINIRGIGLASKLLKYFERNYNPTSVYSFAERRWSVGNLYDQLGFTLHATNPPDYFYVVDGVRKHRWNYRKDILKKTLESYDNTLTEYQNMINVGYDRVWGCGTLKFIKEYN